MLKNNEFLKKKQDPKKNLITDLPLNIKIFLKKLLNNNKLFVLFYHIRYKIMSYILFVSVPFQRKFTYTRSCLSGRMTKRYCLVEFFFYKKN